MITNYFNVSNLLNNFSKLTFLALFNSNEIHINNSNLIKLCIYYDSTIIIHKKFINLTFLYIQSNAKINQNLNEVCPNLKYLVFLDMTDKSLNFTLPILNN